METENILRSIYYDTKNPAGFSSFQRLYEEAKKINENLKRRDVKNWWLGEFTPTLHKPVVRNFKRNPIIVDSIDYQWEADLVDMQEFKSKNLNHSYILTVIDSLSKYAWAMPLKNKKAESIRDAFKIIFEKKRFPIYLRTDQGKEFVNKEFKTFLKDFGVYHFTSKNKDIKCAIVERFNRTLKTRMHKYFTAKGTRKWIDKLDDFISAYNDSYHRTIKRTPNQAIVCKDEELLRTVYGVDDVSKLRQKNQQKFKKDDTVRLMYEKKPFDKGYYPNWTDKIEKIENITDHSVEPMLKIENNEQKFYPQQVQIVKENMYRVEKIIKERIINGKKQFFVKWLNYPDNYNSWVDEPDLINLQD